MLGRKEYTKQEIDHARTAIDRQIAAHRDLVSAIGTTRIADATTAMEAYEPILAIGLTLALDRHFVHRLRVVTGKDSNALNEVELLVDSVMNNGGKLRTGNVIKYVADQTVVKLNVGDQITLSLEQFEQLAAAFFAQLEAKFL